MDPLALLALPRAARPFAATVAPPSRSTRRGAARLVPSDHRCRGGACRRASASAVAPEAPRADEAPAPAEERFDWLDQWYPFAPVGELDPGAPHGKTVLGLSVVAWYDCAAGEWRVFDDACPHRLAPLSEGRIDGKGRLQCVYHGWCFDGAGACQFIPQAPALGPPVHKNAKACVASYPSVVQNQVLWFYPRTEPEYKDVLQRKRPPYFAEIDDPSSYTVFGMRDFLYEYDIMIENLIDPAHVPYTHRGLLPTFPNEEDPGRVEHDREGGDAININIEQASIAGLYRSWKEAASNSRRPAHYMAQILE
uniref:Rieske domain-containing protein n=1 Tax=Setaria viridis TaxID=4556 RepID=A0A4U6SQP5_SETVI|nr:protochlorophyllide-dependent translocon component 52, chloroplastic-like isoform X2 [Setaria viridis]TKV90710.1 hypothetical protein SEVIR_9G046500v2 [Setaria viridis]